MVVNTGTQLVDAEKVLDAGNIKEGDIVADFGAGAVGHYVFPAARRVGKSGKVYAVDIQKSVLDALKGRMVIEGLSNIDLVWGDLERLRGTRIDDNSVDCVFLMNLFSVLVSRDLALQEVMRVLKPGGTLVVIDWRPTGAPFGPEISKRFSKDKAVGAITIAGFQKGKEFFPGPYHYGLVFSKIKD